MAHLVEPVWDLRGEAGARRVARARVGLAHSKVGPEEARACTVAILSR